MECRPSLVCYFQSISFQSRQHPLQTVWGIVQRFLRYRYKRLVISVKFNIGLAVEPLVKLLETVADSQTLLLYLGVSLFCGDHAGGCEANWL